MTTEIMLNQAGTCAVCTGQHAGGWFKEEIDALAKTKNDQPNSACNGRSW